VKGEEINSPERASCGRSCLALSRGLSAVRSEKRDGESVASIDQVADHEKRRRTLARTTRALAFAFSSEELLTTFLTTWREKRRTSETVRRMRSRREEKAKGEAKMHRKIRVVIGDLHPLKLVLVGSQSFSNLARRREKLESQFSSLELRSSREGGLNLQSSRQP